MDFSQHAIAGVFMAVAIYLTFGLIFAIPFVLVGVKRIDPHGEHGSLGFRLLIIPGTTALWPLLLKRWATGAKEPPEANTAHRLATRQSS